MFDQYNQRPPESNHAGRIIGIVLGCISIGLALVRCSLHNSRRYDPSPIDLSSPLYSSSAYSASGSFSRLELPGMSIDAPSQPAPTGDYATGSVQGLGTTQFGITWQPGDFPEKRELANLVAGMSTALDQQLHTTSRVGANRELVMAGKTAQQFDLSTNVGYTMVITFTECDGRIIQLLVAGPGNVQSTVTKMTDSFACTPDPTKDATRIGVAVAVKPGWRRSSEVGRITLVDDKRELFVQPTRLQTTATMTLETFIPTAVKIAGFEVAPNFKTRGDKKVWTGKFTIDGELHAAAVVAWRCPDDVGVGVVYVVSMTANAKLDRGLELAYTGRCLTPSDAVPTYPSDKPAANGRGQNGVAKPK
ncbi:MAG: hypothetical protein ABI867_06870 [Kofleriaceae bacterium]